MFLSSGKGSIHRCTAVATRFSDSPACGSFVTVSKIRLDRRHEITHGPGSLSLRAGQIGDAQQRYVNQVSMVAIRDQDFFGSLGFRVWCAKRGREKIHLWGRIMREPMIALPILTEAIGGSKPGASLSAGFH